MKRPTDRARRAAARLAHRRAEISEANARRARATLERRQCLAIARAFTAGRRTSRRPDAATGPSRSAQRDRDTWTRRDVRADCGLAMLRNPLLAPVVNSLADVLVGQGPRFRFRSADHEWNREAAERVGDWFNDPALFDAAGVIDGPSYLRAAVRACCVDGRLLRVRGADGRVSLIEDERVVNPRQADDGRMHENLIYTAGVGRAADITAPDDRDAAPDAMPGSHGPPVAYHVADWMPGGHTVAVSGRVIDARACHAALNPLDLHAGVVAPVGAIAVLVAMLDELLQSVQAAHEAYWTAAHVAILWEHQNPREFAEQLTAPSPSSVGGIQTPEQTVKDGRDGSLARTGTQYVGDPGFNAKQIVPTHPSQPFIDFAWTLLQLCAANLGLPLELSHLRFTNNFSASRGAMAVGKRRTQRWAGMIRHDAADLARHRVAQLVRADVMPMPRSGDAGDWRRVEVVLPAAPVFDEVAETNALTAQLDAGLTTRRDAVHRLHGTGYEAHERERLEDEAVLDRLQADAEHAAGAVAR